MSKGVNKIILIGNLGADPELRQTTGGTEVANARIAVPGGFTKRGGEYEDQTEWVGLVFFGKIAGVLHKYTQKGSKLYIEGRLQTRKWQDKDGNDRYTTEVVVSDMQMLDSRRDDGSGDTRQTSGGRDEPDDDIPF